MKGYVNQLGVYRLAAIVVRSAVDDYVKGYVKLRKRGYSKYRIWNGPIDNIIVDHQNFIEARRFLKNPGVYDIFPSWSKVQALANEVAEEWYLAGGKVKDNPISQTHQYNLF